MCSKSALVMTRLMAAPGLITAPGAMSDRPTIPGKGARISRSPCRAWAAGWRRVGAAELFLYQLGGSATAHLRRRADGAECALPLAPQAMLAVPDEFDLRIDVDDGPDAALVLVSNKNA